MKTKTDCIAAVSGGPDSMALLDQLVKNGKSPAVVHINYNKRNSAKRDEKITEAYCRKYDLPFIVHYPKMESTGNFQAWARDVRYDKFFEAAKEFEVKDIYVAHHLDDHLETYLIQKKRKSIPSYYGLKECIKRKGLNIKRPLLHQQKKDLEKYCIDHHINYGIDESNLKNDYTRNQIRHSQIEKMSLEEKMQLKDEIEKENEKLHTKRKEALFLLENTPLLQIIENSDNWFAFDLFLYEKTQKHYSKKEILSLMNQLKASCLIDLKDFWLERFQDEILIRKKEILSEITVSNTEELLRFNLNTEDFNYHTETQGKTIESFDVKEEDFPLMIRKVQPGDKILLRNGHKKISRFFIDRKIPKVQRMQWLLIENAHKDIIFVPKIGCDISHFRSNGKFYMLQ